MTELLTLSDHALDVKSTEYCLTFSNEIGDEDFVVLNALKLMLCNRLRE